MNLWECERPTCTVTATGTGGAYGLQAVGWYFQRGHDGRGPIILCPAHRPDGIKCLEGTGGSTCSFCKAEAVAKQFQVGMGAEPW